MSQLNSKRCYLCDSEKLTKSPNQRTINFDGSLYSFFNCKKCGSHSLFPKLNGDTIAKLYSMDYSEISDELHEDESISYISKFTELRNYILADVKSGRKSYLDYGCGFNPITLEIASSAGLDSEGVEFSSDVVAQANLVFPGRVTTLEEFNKASKKYDYVFMGDVIEHLSDPIKVLNEISARLNNHGVLIAQGPLQGAFTFTQMLVGFKSRLFSSKTSSFPPYHVSLASRKGMQEVLKVNQLELINFEISEPQWPAPSLSSVLRRPTIRGLIILGPKLIDRAISKFIPKYGSHYFLVAQKRVE